MVVIFLPATSPTGSRAGAHRLAVHMHGAGAALAMPQPNFVPVKPDFVAEHPKQRRLRLDIEPMRFSVDGDGDHGDTRGAVFTRGGRSAPGCRTRRIVL